MGAKGLTGGTEMKESSNYKQVINLLDKAHNEADEKTAKLLTCEASSCLDNYLEQKYNVKQPTITELVRSIFELSNTSLVESELNIDDLQDLINRDIWLLSEMLGIKLRA